MGSLDPLWKDSIDKALPSIFVCFTGEIRHELVPVPSFCLRFGSVDFFLQYWWRVFAVHLTYRLGAEKMCLVRCRRQQCNPLRLTVGGLVCSLTGSRFLSPPTGAQHRSRKGAMHTKEQTDAICVPCSIRSRLAFLFCF